MALTVEKLLNDANTLITRLKDDDFTAERLIGSMQALNNRIDAMKQYQDDITELNEIAKHRPRSTLVLGLAQENRQIRELQQENRELKMSLEEHQSAMELIMKKYREQIGDLINSNQVEKLISQQRDDSKDEVLRLLGKIDEMASVMQSAVKVDDQQIIRDQEQIRQLQLENQTLREILQVSSGPNNTGSMPGPSNKY
ncbi:FGFR1 oncogene partner 2 homolog [Gigantopelta aegis]|uniref:FGFR1 oncogene partner 2 homolog n=1 Tax=Gigantopelta aegis TaxID=1735272 RepID=UPI001B88B3FD|nr:FGFR1 oncogene partner 2 homolog [Gigantopelta aegis]XP_041365975.1 FGFR1 oncogene partner 2 homolog [Gigantopelta aegis]